MKVLKKFRNLMLKNTETSKTWKELEKKAHDYCKINYKVVTARTLKEKYPKQWDVDREKSSEDFMKSFQKLHAVCEKLGIEMPQFGAFEICRLAD